MFMALNVAAGDVAMTCAQQRDGSLPLPGRGAGGSLTLGRNRKAPFALLRDGA